MEIIVTDKITLKKLQLEFAPSLFNLVDQNRDFLREWLIWVDHTK